MHRRGAHRAQTHRVQWNIILRELAINPTLFGLTSTKDISTPEVLATIVSPEVSAGLDIRSECGCKSLWTLLFDSYEFNFSAPMFIVRKVMPYTMIEWD